MNIHKYPLISLFIFFGLFFFASPTLVYPVPHHFQRRFRLLVSKRAKRLRLDANLLVKFYRKMVLGPVAGRRKFSLPAVLFALTFFLVVTFFSIEPAYEATEFKSTVKPSGGDYFTAAAFDTAQIGNIGAGECGII